MGDTGSGESLADQQISHRDYYISYGVGTTPGPLIIVVAFVGFMTGYNHFRHSLWMGTLTLLATTFYTLLRWLSCSVFRTSVVLRIALSIACGLIFGF